MTCEDIENRLSDLGSQKQTIETNLANCLEASVTDVSMETIGYVGTVEVETAGTVRLWFGLTKSKGKADWIKIGPAHHEPGSGGQAILPGVAADGVHAIGAASESQPRWCSTFPQIRAERFVRGRWRQSAAFWDGFS